MIRVAIVEDQRLVREGLKQLLAFAADIEVIAEIEDGEAAIERLPEINPDVVLLDMRMPKMNGLEVLRELGRQDKLPPTPILTTFDEDEFVLGGIRAGAKGFLLKDVSLDQLTGAIRTIHEGGTLFQPAVTERVMKRLDAVEHAFESADIADALTPRETEILRLVAGGYSNKEIADAVGVSSGTVKNHVSSVLSKLGVRDRTRAVLRALELGSI